MRMLALLVAALGVVCCSGLVHGLWTDRWAKSGDREQAVARLESVDFVPIEGGDWECDRVRLDAADLARVGIDGHLSLRFRHRYTGARLSVLLVCGRPGPVAVHTPDVCYRASGFQQSGSAERRQIQRESNTPAAEFWDAHFSRPAPVKAQQLRVLWAWTADGNWQAPDNPRVVLGGQPYLYKLYLIHEIGPAEKRGKEDVALRFLRQLLPSLEPALFGPNESPPTASSS